MKKGSIVGAIVFLTSVLVTVGAVFALEFLDRSEWEGAWSGYVSKAHLIAAAVGALIIGGLAAAICILAFAVLRGPVGIICLATLIIVGMCAFPPYNMVWREPGGDVHRWTAYAPIWYYTRGYAIDANRLLPRCLIVAGVAAAGVVIMKLAKAAAGRQDVTPRASE